jgi:hypothetical protein
MTFHGHLITYCKGRLHHLRTTLPKMLEQECDVPYRVIVVDYGSPDGAFDWCRKMFERAARPLAVLRVMDDVAEYHRSRSRNIGAAAAGSGLLAFVDADAVLRPPWLASAWQPIQRGEAVLTTPDWSLSETYGEKGIGICAVHSETFHAVRGFDEAMRGWGYEDDDFCQRCRQLGPTGLSDGRQIALLPHGPDDRTRFHGIKLLRESRQANKRRARARWGPVNPAGYGRGQLERWCNKAHRQIAPGTPFSQAGSMTSCP